MPKHKDLKRRVRVRMQKTGESYTAARVQIVRARPPREPDLASRAGMSDDAVRGKTGKAWRQWVQVLDADGAAQMSHRDIARLLADVHRVPPWWSQMVAVGYERIRGLRAAGQSRTGEWSVGKSKTVAVPVRTLYRAFAPRARKAWLGDAKLAVRKATPNKSMRISFGDGTPVDVTFLAKGAGKSLVHIEHRRLPSQAEAARLRAFWAERLAALTAHLAVQPTR